MQILCAGSKDQSWQLTYQTWKFGGMPIILRTVLCLVLIMNSRLKFVLLFYWSCIWSVNVEMKYEKLVQIIAQFTVLHSLSKNKQFVFSFHLPGSSFPRLDMNSLLDISSKQDFIVDVGWCHHCIWPGADWTRARVSSELESPEFKYPWKDFLYHKFFITHWVSLLFDMCTKYCMTGATIDTLEIFSQSKKI